MTTKTYQALCDDVGAYKKQWVSCTHRAECMRMDGCITPCVDDNSHKVKNYPLATADQRERLEELILNLGRLSYHKSDIYYICILSRVNNANNGIAGTRPDALYALTQKLVDENVLSKEEVKEALNG